MAVYSAPEGFIWDPATGLYVRKSIITDGAGIRYRHRMFFNADTGEYTQFSEPIVRQAQPVQPAYAPHAPVSKTKAAKTKKVKTKAAVKTAKKKRGAWFYIGTAAVIAIVLFLTVSRNDKMFKELSDEQKEEFVNDYIVEELPAWSVDAEPYYGEINGGGIIR